MKILKDNKWNTIFHKKAIIKQTELYDRYQNMVRKADELLKSISEAKYLTKLVSYHKDAWRIGFRNINIAPNEFGMFRTKDILSMTVDEVYLGGIYGLNTYSIRFWEDRKEESIGSNGFGMDHNIKIYSLIMSQYRSLLQANIRAMRNEARDYITQYDLVNPPKDPTKIL